MKFEIKSEHGHYVMYVNGRFYGTYDTISEAAEDIEALKKKEEVA